jgi:DNA repair protein RadC
MILLGDALWDRRPWMLVAIHGILLDKRHRVIECIDLFRGTIDGASVHPREVVKLALEKSAAACIVYHNHRSGVQEPSQADELIRHA